MVKTTASSNNPLPCPAGLGSIPILSIYSLECRPQNIETAAGAHNSQIVCRRAPRVSMFAPPIIESAGP
eukprot:13720413-Alexandrium_andersonii.AAC.1